MMMLCAKLFLLDEKPQLAPNFSLDAAPKPKSRSTRFYISPLVSTIFPQVELAARS